MSPPPLFVLLFLLRRRNADRQIYRSALVADMGEEDTVKVDQNSFDGGEEDSLLRNPHSSLLPPPPQHLSSKVLTLPTVLTLGRVAAVPILVASTFDCFGSPDYGFFDSQFWLESLSLFGV